MSFNGALQIGRSAIMTSQAAMQVAGNNMANASTPGYNRQVARMSSSLVQAIGRGNFVGTGVQLERIMRTVDVALQGRARAAVSEENAALIDQRFLNSVESVRNALGEGNLSDRLGAFFSSFSELANNPADEALRSVVVQQSSGLANSIRALRNDHVAIRSEIDRSIQTAVRAVDSLLTQVAEINGQISVTEQGGTAGVANDLRDRRDTLIAEISQYVPVSVVEQPTGAVDLLVNSVPVVFGAESRGLRMETLSVDGSIEVSVRVNADGSLLSAQDGQIGALLRQRDQTVEPAIADLDNLASQLIFQVNRIHSQGQGSRGLTTVTGLNTAVDASATLENAGFDFPIRNGSFELGVTSVATGLRTTVLVEVDPSSMTLNQLAAAINAAMPAGTGSASVTATGALRLDAASGYELSFANDSSGALATLGINSLFGGSDASSIAVNESIAADPRLLAVGRDHVPGSNKGALEIAALETAAVDELGGRSLRAYWSAVTSELGVRTEAANSRAESTTLVRQSLDAQIESISGVSVDEESINLLSYQRQFQAAARFISTIDETMRALLAI
jgi:flagellar hook-associated protein 1 FlgK